MSKISRGLREIDSLIRCLSAEIVVQEEIGHYEQEMDFLYPPRDIWVVDKPQEVISDSPKINTASTRLRQIYDSCEYYSLRYEAGKALGYVDFPIETWAEELIAKAKIDKKSTIGNTRFVNDIGRLFSMTRSQTLQRLLLEIHETNPSPIVRFVAGRNLGYGFLGSLRG